MNNGSTKALHRAKAFGEAEEGPGFESFSFWRPAYHLWEEGLIYPPYLSSACWQGATLLSSEQWCGIGTWDIAVVWEGLPWQNTAAPALWSDGFTPRGRSGLIKDLLAFLYHPSMELASHPDSPFIWGRRYIQNSGWKQEKIALLLMACYHAASLSSACLKTSGRKNKHWPVSYPKWAFWLVIHIPFLQSSGPQSLQVGDLDSSQSSFLSLSVSSHACLWKIGCFYFARSKAVASWDNNFCLKVVWAKAKAVVSPLRSPTLWQSPTFILGSFPGLFLCRRLTRLWAVSGPLTFGTERSWYADGQRLLL